MSLQLGDTAPDFEAETTEGRISFHKWLGDSWGVLFSHPKDFTPICTTELGFMANTKAEYDKRNAKILAVSVDSVEDHKRWAKDIGETQGTPPNYPIIGDTDLKVAKLYNMLPAGASGDVSKRTPVDNQTVRNVFLISPDKKISLILIYPMSVGRNFNEILRALDALQLTRNHKVGTPANWGVEGHSKDVAISASLSDDEAKKLFPKGFKELKKYLRITPDPR
jgi:alkyl hydroperoxide reductase subunit AhpC